MHRFIKTALVTSLFVFAATAVHAETADLYKIVKTVPIGAPDKWDYLHFDAAAQRLYVAHGDRLTVLDGKSGALIGTVGDMPGGSHGIAIASAAGKGYTDDGKQGEVVVFDLKTLKVIQKIKAADDADAVVLDKASGHVFVIDGDTGKITVVDSANDAVLATIAVGGKLEFAASGDNGKLYVNGEEKRELIRIDIATNKVDARWPIADCESPHGLAVDIQHHRLFSGCVNQKMVVVNTDTGAEVASLTIGNGSDAIGFDPARQLVFSSNFEGTLSVIRENTPDNYTALAPAKTAIGARTMALDAGTGRVYLTTADYTVNAAAAPTDFRHHYKMIPGTAKILFLDPKALE